jgi:hypothetical protein
MAIIVDHHSVVDLDLPRSQAEVLTTTPHTEPLAVSLAAALHY